MYILVPFGESYTKYIKLIYLVTKPTASSLVTKLTKEINVLTEIMNLFMCSLCYFNVTFVL
jgi:hypothetical protein